MAYHVLPYRAVYMLLAIPSLKVVGVIVQLIDVHAQYQQEADREKYLVSSTPNGYLLEAESRISVITVLTLHELRIVLMN